VLLHFKLNGARTGLLSRRGASSKIERTFLTRREAELWLDELKHTVRSGTFIDPDNRHTLAQVADEWLATLSDVSPRTRAGYAHILEKHLLPRWGKAKVSAITADRIQQWVNEDLTFTNTGRQRAPNTVRNIYNVLREVLALAVRRRYLAANPCTADTIKLPGKSRASTGPRLQTLTPAEINKLAAATPAQYRTALLVAAQTGLRAAELWALRRADIDLLRGTITVDETLQEVPELGLVFGPPKPMPVCASSPFLLLQGSFSRSTSPRPCPGLWPRRPHLHDSIRQARPPQPLLPARV
jgi:integrase-like protein